jgi:hypothetical protein
LEQELGGGLIGCGLDEKNQGRCVVFHLDVAFVIPQSPEIMPSQNLLSAVALVWSGRH